MWRCLILFFAFISAIPLSATEFPKHFYVQYQKLTNGTLFDVMRKDGSPFGRVIRKKGVREQLFYQSLDDELIAYAEIEKNDSTIIARLKKSSGEQIGWFLATIYNFYPTEYKLYKKEDLLIASGSMNWVGTRFTLVDPHNGHIEFATFFRRRFIGSEAWHVEINRDNEIDPATLVIIGAFQSSLNLGLEG